VSKRLALALALAAAGVAAAALAVQTAVAAPHRAAAPKKAAAAGMLLGINDEASTLYGNPPQVFPQLKSLGVKVLRVNLYWGGTPWAVAKTKPQDPTDPGDQAYDWSLYDRLARYAETYHIQLMFSILFTPHWANGAKPNMAPKTMQALQDFAEAAATRYNGFYIPPDWQQQPTLEKPTEPLPAVSLWTAWNEPNNPVFLTPQYKRVGGKWVVQSAKTYAQICNAVYKGVHSTTIAPGAVTLLGPKVAEKEQVACGVTDPKGNDAPATSRASVDPLTFLAAAKAAHMGPIDAYAHNPYPSSGKETPTYVPTGKTARRIQMGNIGTLIKKVSAYYGSKPIWITEYGYQTNPPNRTIFGTSWQNQAAWLKESVQIAKRNPRIKIFLWYLLRDDGSKQGWQSGLMTTSGQKKPSWNAFKSVAG
jgi:hypothetical protein